MGHGIFPYYGMQYAKTWMHVLSPADKKEVFFPSKKSKAIDAKPAEDAQHNKKQKKN